MDTADDDGGVPGLNAGPGSPAPRVDLSGVPADLAVHLAALERAAAAVAGYDLRGLDGAQAAVVAAVLAGVRSRVGAAHAVVLAVIEADGLWATDGSRSFTAWVAGLSVGLCKCVAGVHGVRPGPGVRGTSGRIG